MGRGSELRAQGIWPRTQRLDRCAQARELHAQGSQAGNPKARNPKRKAESLARNAVTSGREALTFARKIPKPCAWEFLLRAHRVKPWRADISTWPRLRDTLGILPNHNVRIFVGVEGPNDIEFLSRISAVLSATEPDIPNLQAEEQPGRIVYIPMGSSTLELWTNRLQGLAIPEVHVMDRDNAPPLPPKYQASADRVNARGAGAIAFTTSCREMENLIHPDAINDEFGQNHLIIQPFDDVPALVAELVHVASGSPTAWAALDEAKREKKISKAKRRLNRGAVDRMTPNRLNASDPADEVRTWLRRIGQHLQ